MRQLPRFLQTALRGAVQIATDHEDWKPGVLVASHRLVCFSVQAGPVREPSPEIAGLLPTPALGGFYGCSLQPPPSCVCGRDDWLWELPATDRASAGELSSPSTPASGGPRAP